MKNIKKHLKFIVFLFIIFATVGLETAFAAEVDMQGDGLNKIEGVPAAAQPKAKADADLKIDAVKPKKTYASAATQTDPYTLVDQAKTIDGLLKRVSAIEATRTEEDGAKKLKDLLIKVEKVENDSNDKQTKSESKNVLDFLNSIPGSGAAKKYLAMVEKYSMLAYPAVSMLNVPASKVPVVNMFSGLLDSWVSKVIITSIFIRGADLFIKFKNNKITFADYKANKNILGHFLSIYAAYKGRNLTANYLGQTI